MTKPLGHLDAEKPDYVQKATFLIFRSPFEICCTLMLSAKICISFLLTEILWRYWHILVQNRWHHQQVTFTWVQLKVLIIIGSQDFSFIVIHALL